MKNEGPYERVRDAGVNAASVIDLLAVAFSRRESDTALAEPVARKMLQRFGSLKELCEAGATDLDAMSGLGAFEVLRVMALIEVGRRCRNTRAGERDTIDTAEDAIPYIEHLRYEKREHFVAILLDSKNHLIRVTEVHVGTLTASLVGPREVFREAIRDGASSVIVAHNHPSGDPTPSPEDIDVTRRLVEVGVLLDIPVLDHIILGEYCKSLKGGRDIGRTLGRNRAGIARESAGYARGEGIGAWALPDAGTAFRPIDPPRPSTPIRGSRTSARRGQGGGRSGA